MLEEIQRMVERNAREKLEAMTSRDMRCCISPSQEMYAEALEMLEKAGWKWMRDSRVYLNGWWTHSGHPTQSRPNGDSKNLHLGAWDTLMLYVKP